MPQYINIQISIIIFSIIHKPIENENLISFNWQLEINKYIIVKYNIQFHKKNLSYKKKKLFSYSPKLLPFPYY